MFCPNCGHQNPENAANCQRCSAPLASGAATVGKPAPKFKGTMLMTSSSENFGPPGGPPRPPPGNAAQFQKTMVGGISVVDPASLGGDDNDDGFEARTVMQPSQFDAQRPPPGPTPAAGGPGLGAPPRAPAPPTPPAPPRAPTPTGAMTGASTMAVDASAFGLPGAGPPAAPQRPQTPAPQPAAQRPQTPAPQPAAQRPAPQAPVHTPDDDAVSGVASTLAVDASAFGLGGPGMTCGTGGPSPFGQPPQQQQGGPFGHQPQ